MATSTDATTEQLAACSIEGPTVYTSEKNGNDETGDGSEGKPFKTPLQVFACNKLSFKNILFDQAYRQHGENVTVYVDSKDETKVRLAKMKFEFICFFQMQGKWELLSKAQAKKVKGRYEEEKRKEKAAAEREVNSMQKQ